MNKIYYFSSPFAIGLSNAVRAVALMFGPVFYQNMLQRELTLFIDISRIINNFMGFMQNNFYISLNCIYLL